MGEGVLFMLIGCKQAHVENTITGDSEQRCSSLSHMFEKHVIKLNMSFRFFLEQNIAYPDYIPSKIPNKHEKHHDQLTDSLNIIYNHWMKILWQ